MNNNKFVLIVVAILLSFCFISFMQNMNFEQQHNYEVATIDATTIDQINEEIRAYSNENGIALKDEKFIPNQSIEDEDSIIYKVNCITKDDKLITFEVVYMYKEDKVSVLS